MCGQHRWCFNRGLHDLIRFQLLRSCILGFHPCDKAAAFVGKAIQNCGESGWFVGHQPGLPPLRPKFNPEVACGVSFGRSRSESKVLQFSSLLKIDSQSFTSGWACGAQLSTFTFTQRRNRLLFLPNNMATVTSQENQQFNKAHFYQDSTDYPLNLRRFSDGVLNKTICPLITEHDRYLTVLHSCT